MDEFEATIPRVRPYEIINFNGEFGGCRSKFTAEVRVSLASADDVKNWVGDFGASLHCNFILTDSRKRKNVQLFRRYSCHLSKFNKQQRVSERSSAPNLRHRNYDCKAAISFSIYTGNDYALIKNLPAKVEIGWDHNHNVDNAHYLSLLRPLKETKQRFLNYFDNGMTPAEATKAHQESLDSDGSENSERKRANKAFNPSKATIYYWHTKWREMNFGERCCSYGTLKEKLSNFAENRIIIRLNEDPFAVLIVTPIMSRLHSLSSSSEICFVDSTATCDVENHSITFMLSRCCVGAAPLAIFITSDQTESSYRAAFRLLKEAMGNTSFGKFFYCINTTRMMLLQYRFQSQLLAFLELIIAIATFLVRVTYVLV